MENTFSAAYRSGFERLVAWANLLDEINVFPVADGDTGRNLVLSLSPFKRPVWQAAQMRRWLLLSARGNSGNIAARFFSGFLQAKAIADLGQAAASGNLLARQAVRQPLSGTMLSVFDALAGYLAQHPIDVAKPSLEPLVRYLAEVTAATPEQLPRLKQAGVVDAGALGMFIFLEGYFKVLTGDTAEYFPLVEFFKQTLRVSPEFKEKGEAGFCIDTVLRIDPAAAGRVSELTQLGDSVVVIADADRIKVHLHAQDAAAVRDRFATFGDVLNWAADDLAHQVADFSARGQTGAVHIMTDAAGSITREAAQRLGITLLDSYVITAEKSLPETLFAPEEIYAAMRAGRKVSTAQASEYERHQYYRRVLSQYARVLYLCVGSVYTGNYQVARAWKEEHDPEDRLTLVDTTAASGRLSVLVQAVVRYAHSCADPAAVVEFARQAIPRCEEFIFLHRLKYLAAGGRLSKGSAMMGDLLHLKPVVSPTAEGARKVGAVQSREGQIQFALDRLQAALPPNPAAEIMLQHSDNRTWVAEVVQARIQKHYPEARIQLEPLSLTAGVHMGPGTWAIAFMREG